MKYSKGYHLLFGVALLLLGALGLWWSIFFLQAVELERSAQLAQLRHMALVTALELGHMPQPPQVGEALPGQPSLEIVAVEGEATEDLLFLTVPQHPGFAVQIREEAVLAVDERLRRRRIMFAGEGALLLLLVGVCTVMLYRLVRAERRGVRRMEAFLGAVTHEMKTPLTGIRSLFQTMAAGRVPESELSRLLAMGLKETERLEHMVENVLASGRLRAGRQPLHPESTPLRPFLEAFLEHRQRYMAGSPGRLRLVWEACDDGLHAAFDPAALLTVLENLTDNAFKYGGEEPEVTLRADCDNGRVRLHVEDKGQGFSPDQAESLFVPFQRAHGERNAAQHGTGLGLSISRSLTRRMGGRLTAHSEGAGRGARFTVELPEAEAKG